VTIDARPTRVAVGTITSLLAVEYGRHPAVGTHWTRPAPQAAWRLLPYGVLGAVFLPRLRRRLTNAARSARGVGVGSGSYAACPSATSCSVSPWPPSAWWPCLPASPRAVRGRVPPQPKRLPLRRRRGLPRMRCFGRWPTGCPPAPATSTPGRWAPRCAGSNLLVSSAPAWRTSTTVSAERSPLVRSWSWVPGAIGGSTGY
jgi:hypothetical protein